MDEFLKYDYLELVIFDVHCMPKGRLVAKQRIESAVKNGIGLYAGICYFGIREEPATHDYFGASRNFGNVLLIPIPETLTDVLPSGRKKHNVGQVLCELKTLDGAHEVTAPRFVTEKQLQKLSSMGYRLQSSIEHEFAIYHADTLKPYGHDKRWANMRVIGNEEDVFLDFIEELKAINISADTLQTEAGSGQYEITLDLTEGIQAADMSARFKNAAYIFFNKKGLLSSFMTRDQLQGFSHGFHFNHSLWTPDGKSVFLDAKDPDKLSAIGRHWLAGLVTHTPAMTALCCPTVNCYRRLHNPWVPSVADWCLQKRNAAFRLKVEGEDNVYIENRIPSSASNPYLVMAAVVAAGMDGIERKLSLEKANCEQELPHSLEEALTALEKDQCMVNALGKQFVAMYAHVKRAFEIEPLKVKGITDEIKLELEKEMYFYQC